MMLEVQIPGVSAKQIHSGFTRYTFDNSDIVVGLHRDDFGPILVSMGNERTSDKLRVDDYIDAYQAPDDDKAVLTRREFQDLLRAVVAQSA